MREQSGGLVPYDGMGTKIGDYDPKTGGTRDRTGKQVGKGNLLATLL